MRRPLSLALMAFVLAFVSSCPGPNNGHANIAPTVEKPAPGRPEAQSGIGKEPIDRVQRATVFITSWFTVVAAQGDQDTSPEERGSYGSGFIADASGLILTNRHVVEWGGTGKGEFGRLARVTVRTNSGRPESKEYPATVLTMFELPFDLALLQITPTERLEALDLGDEEKLGLTEKVWAAGFPQGGNMEEWLKEHTKLGKNTNGPDFSVRGGEVSSLRRDERNKVKIIESTCPIEHGNSGGPLVDSSGRVVGINTYLINPEAHASKSYGSLPVRHVHEQLGSTLGAFARVAKSGRTPQTLRIDPVNGPLLGLKQALDKHQDGDEILLPGGKTPLYSTDNIPMKGLVRIRGTVGSVLTLPGQSAWVISASEGACVLVSNVSIEQVSGGFPKGALGISGSGTCFLTNVSIYNGTLTVSGKASAHVFGCELGLFKLESNSTALRLGHLMPRAQDGRDMPARCSIVAGTVALFNCDFSRIWSGISLNIEGNAALQGVSLHGCNFAPTGLGTQKGFDMGPDWVPLVVAGGKCTLSDCVLSRTEIGGSSVLSEVLFESCFHRYPGVAVKSNSRVTFNGCSLRTRGSPCIRSDDLASCQLSVAGCSFWYLPQSRLVFMDADGEKSELERFDAVTYGILYGRQVKFSCANCSFAVDRSDLSGVTFHEGVDWSRIKAKVATTKAVVPEIDQEVFRRNGNQFKLR